MKRFALILCLIGVASILFLNAEEQPTPIDLGTVAMMSH